MKSPQKDTSPESAYSLASTAFDWEKIKKFPVPRVIIIAGPTASGKTTFSLQMTTEVNGEIINADSMQLYKDLPLLSALPILTETAGIPHHLYGILEAQEQFSVAMWLEKVLILISDIKKREKTPIIVGGTGLYINALLNGLYSLPSISSHHRQKAREDWEKLGALEFHSMLSLYDPASTAILHPNNKQRLIRSWEFFLETGKSMREFQSIIPTPPLGNDNILKILLFPDKEILEKRADLRFEKMIQMGAVAEVQQLLERGIPISAPIFRTLGARELARSILGEQSLEVACERTKIATHQYIKRQRTWFRHQYVPAILLQEF